MKVAVIIPTRGRDESLRQTLKDLARQRLQGFEVWVVDQNDKPLPSLDADIGAVKLHHVAMEPLGSHAGRNRAIFETVADLCVFVDDDVRVAEDFLERHVKLMLEKSIGALESKVVAVAGRVVQPNDHLSEDQMRRMGRLGKYCANIGRVSGNFYGFESGDVDHIHECNFSAKTRALREIGGFNTAFEGNAYFEGADLALRLKSAGGQVVYCPEVSLIHLQAPSGGNRVTQKSRHTYWFMRNYMLLNRLHMHVWGWPVFFFWSSAYVFGKFLKNRDSEIFFQGFRGLFDGFQYFLKPKKALIRTKLEQT